MSVVDELLPPQYTFGKVIGRFLLAVADTPQDADALPQARPVSGTATFTPGVTLRKILDVGDGTGAFVSQSAVIATIDQDGYLIDEEGNDGIWLVTGMYSVAFQLSDPRAAIQGFDIELMESHDDLNPLDLPNASPYTEGPGITIVSYQMPSGGNEGDVMTRTATGAGWETRPVVTASQTEPAAPSPGDIWVVVP